MTATLPSFDPGKPKPSLSQVAEKEVTHLYPIRRGDVWLEPERIQKRIEAIPHLLGYTPSHFEYERDYVGLIRRFSEQVVQGLPATEEAYFKHQGGLLELALERMNIGLMQWQRLQQTWETPIPDLPLWGYAIFSALLLRDAGRLYSDMHLFLCDAQGAPQRLWTPLLGTPIHPSNHYLQVDFANTGWEYLRGHITVLIAKNVMDPNAFLSMASNPHVFEFWLALLSDTFDRNDPLGQIFTLSHQYAIARDLEGFWSHAGADQVHSDLFNHPMFEPSLNPTHAGKAFFLWLKHHLNAALFDAHSEDGLIQQVEEGLLLLTPDIFMEFCKKHGRYPDWQKVKQSFLALDLVEPSDDGFEHEYESKDSKKKTRGLLIRDPHLIFKISQEAFYKRPAQGFQYKYLLRDNAAYKRRVAAMLPTLSVLSTLNAPLKAKQENIDKKTLSTTPTPRPRR